MKILHVLAGFNTGGVESFILNLLKSFEGLDYEMDFLIRTSENDSNKIEYLKKRECKIYCVSEWPRKMVSNYFEMRNIYIKYCKEYQYIHIHANALIYFLPIYFARKYMPETQIIIHSHNTQPKEKWMTVIHNLNKLRLRRYSTINLACGNDAGKWMFDNCYKVIPNSISFDNFISTIEEKKKIKMNAGIENEVVLMAIGRLEKQKNIQFLLPVMKELLKYKFNYHLYLVGDGSLKSLLEEECKKLNIIENVHFVGNKSNVGEYLKRCDILLMPSLYEGLSISLLEAQTAGVSAVVSENISNETVLCPNIVQMPLKYEKWVETILEITRLDNFSFKPDNWQFVSRAGYDLEGLKKSMSNIYRKIGK